MKYLRAINPILANNVTHSKSVIKSHVMKSEESNALRHIPHICLYLCFSPHCFCLLLQHYILPQGGVGMLALLLLSEKALGDASNYAVYIKVRRSSTHFFSTTFHQSNTFPL